MPTLGEKNEMYLLGNLSNIFWHVLDPVLCLMQSEREMEFEGKAAWQMERDKDMTFSTVTDIC